MLIFPAIDIIDGNVVRLTRGDYGSVKRYTLSPPEAAREFRAAGAKYLHVVDLDGARSGSADNAAVISRLVKELDMIVEVGGGIRNCAQAERYLECGVQKIILGTAAVRDGEFLKTAVKNFGGAVEVGVDAFNGNVAIEGWKNVTSVNALEFCKYLQDLGVEHIIYTDISRDGTLNGTNLDIYQVLCDTLSIKITASGGITYVSEIEKLKNIGVHAAILGKALYEGKLNLGEAIVAAGIQ